MNATISLFFDNSVSQVNDEALHLTFLAITGGATVVFSVLSWFLRRDIKRFDDNQKAVAESVVSLEEKVDRLKDRHGSEINDTRLAIERLFAKAGLEPPTYPSRS